MSSKETAVLIVTYGDRSRLLRRVYERVSFMNLKHIIIVDNGVYGNSIDYLKSIENDKNLSIIRNYDNIGSSGGISIGMLYFMNLGIEYLWILDDDNLPDTNALVHLIDCSKLYDMQQFALHSLRLDSHGRSSLSRQVSRSTFYEFNLYDIVTRFKRKTGNEDFEKTGTLTTDYAPYGGLFISRYLIDSIGLPLKDMYLYVDDTEFTWRISSRGGGIITILKSIISDIDDNWSNVYPKPSFFNQFLFEEPFFRGFYSIRNHAFFDNNFWSNNRMLYKFNKMLFILLLFIFSIINGKLPRFLVILKAISQGEKGELGRLNT